MDDPKKKNPENISTYRSQNAASKCLENFQITFIQKITTNATQRWNNTNCVASPSASLYFY